MPPESHHEESSQKNDLNQALRMVDFVLQSTATTKAYSVLGEFFSIAHTTRLDDANLINFIPRMF